MPCLFGDEPFAAKDAQRFPHRSPAYAQQAAHSSSEGSLRSGPHCVRANSRIASFTSTYRGSRCSLTRLTSDDFSITHPMWPVNVFPLRKIRRKADISSSRFCGKGCHAIPRGSSCARYVSKATKEMASGLPRRALGHMPIRPPFQQRRCSSSLKLDNFFSAMFHGTIG